MKERLVVRALLLFVISVLLLEAVEELLVEPDPVSEFAAAGAVTGFSAAGLEVAVSAAGVEVAIDGSGAAAGPAGSAVAVVDVAVWTASTELEAV